MPVWIIVALVAEILWVTGNLFDKYLLEKYFKSENEEGGAGTLIIFSGFFGFIVALGSFFVGDINVSIAVAIPGLILGLLNALWVWLYILAIDRTELTRIIPALQTVPIFGLLFSFLMLGETITSMQAFAGLIILLGAGYLSYYKSITHARFDYKSLVLIMSAAAIIGFSDVLFKDIALSTNYWTTAFWMGLGIGLFGMILYATVSAYRKQFNSFIIKKNKNVFLANGLNEIIDSAANLIFAAATILGPISLVQTTNAYQPFLILIFGVLLTRFIPNFYDEDISKVSLTQKIIGITAVTLGSLLMYTTI